LKAGERPHATRLLAAAGATLLVALGVWFFVGTDREGRTARLAADAWYYHAWLPSLVLDGDVDLADEYAVFGNFYDFPRAQSGLYSNVFGIGPALAELPLFLAGHLLARAGGVEADGFSRPEVEASLFASVLYGFGSIVFAWRLVRRRLPDGPAALACALVFLGGPAVYYAVRQPGYTHPMAAFWIAWLLDVFDASLDHERQARPLRSWLALGALVGAAALARPQLTAWGVVLAIAAIDDFRRLQRELGRARAALRAAASLSAAIALAGAVFAPQMLVWRATYGAWLVTPQGEGFMWWDDPAWTAVLFASRNGLLPWSPLLALALIGLLASVRRQAWTASALLAGTALQWLVNAAAWDWWAGGSYGGRRFDSCYAAFAFGLGFLFTVPAGAGRPSWRRGLRAGVGVLALWLAGANLALVAQRSVANVPIGGGRPAWSVWRQEVHGLAGRVTAAASALANLPARAAFAWRHGVPLDRYDQVVGVHALDDRFPGLNADARAPWRSLPLDPRSPNVFGTAAAERPGLYRLPGGRARILVGFNRRGPVQFSLEVTASEPTGRVRILLNGEEIASGPAGSALAGRARRLARGTNVLVIEAPPSARLAQLAVWAEGRRASRFPTNSTLEEAIVRPGEAAIDQPASHRGAVRVRRTHDVVEVVQPARRRFALQPVEDERPDPSPPRVRVDREQYLGVTPRRVHPAVADNASTVLDPPPFAGDQLPRGERSEREHTLGRAADELLLPLVPARRVLVDPLQRHRRDPASSAERPGRVYASTSTTAAECLRDRVCWVAAAAP
jgi:hypothetical protein